MLLSIYDEFLDVLVKATLTPTLVEVPTFNVWPYFWGPNSSYLDQKSDLLLLECFLRESLRLANADRQLTLAVETICLTKANRPRGILSVVFFCWKAFWMVIDTLAGGI